MLTPVTLVAMNAASRRENRREETMPHNPIRIANRLIGIAGEAGKQLTPLQLIKLVYIAHGWTLAYLSHPLVNEPAQAWQYGPVIPSIYYAAKGYRNGPITAPLVGGLSPQAPLPDAEEKMLRTVWASYGRFSGIELSELTHQPGTPWSETWAEKGRNAQIPDDRIRAHYLELANRQAA